LIQPKVQNSITADEFRGNHVHLDGLLRLGDPERSDERESHAERSQALRQRVWKLQGHLFSPSLVVLGHRLRHSGTAFSASPETITEDYIQTVLYIIIYPLLVETVGRKVHENTAPFYRLAFWTQPLSLHYKSGWKT
jgi:hypothetical protein